MSKLEKIEREIEALAPEGLASFRAWFAEFDAANRDAKIEADAQAAAWMNWRKRRWRRTAPVRPRGLPSN